MTQATYGRSVSPAIEARVPAPSDAPRVLLLALAMAAAAPACPLLPTERAALTAWLAAGEGDTATRRRGDAETGGDSGGCVPRRVPASGCVPASPPLSAAWARWGKTVLVWLWQARPALAAVVARAGAASVKRGEVC